MKRAFFSILSLFFIIIPSQAWKIDTQLKFNYAYYTPTTMTGIITASALNYTHQIGKPDITNILLNNLLNLGFPITVPGTVYVPHSTFYLKFYTFPKKLNPVTAFQKIRHAFLLDKFTPFNTVATYSKRSKNNVIKVGFIASSTRQFNTTHPFPNFAVQSQENFNTHIPFVSLYILPSKTSRTFSNNIRGVQNLYKQLQQYYAKHFKLLYKDKNNAYYMHRIKETLIVVTFPKKLLIFNHNQWKKLPMPQSSHMFLSSLLLLYSAKYKVAKGVRITTYTQLQQIKPYKRIVFEIPSVYRTN